MAQTPIDWGVASRCLPGQTAMGDRHLIKPIKDGVLLAVFDGMGHGPEAAAAAMTAIDVVESHAEEPLSRLIQRCHEGLTKTRGVVMTLATLQPLENRLTWLAVGNVEAVLLPASGRSKCRRALLRSGVVGYQLPAVHAATLPIAAGDLLILATDGIRPEFTEDLVGSQLPQEIADGILRRHFKGSDDALALVVRYVGTGHESSRA